MTSGTVLVALLGMGSAHAEIVIQVYPRIQYLPAEQILSESGLAMIRWGQAVQRLPSNGKPLAISGPRLGSQRNRHLKIAYIYVATTSPAHTAGQGNESQTGAITTESQADAAQHERWHIDVAIAAAAKANELEARLLSLAFAGATTGQCRLESGTSDLITRIDQAVLKRFHTLKDNYNAKLHAISFAGVVNGVWRDNASDQAAAEMRQLLADLRAEPVEEEISVAENTPRD